jgi:hypothetical protein
MAVDYKCPLGDEHCQLLDKALQTAAQARQLAQDCVDCGLPMHDELAAIKNREELATALKAKFFPNRV